MIYTREQFESIPVRELLENHRRWLAGNSGEHDEYVVHKIMKVEEVDGIVYIEYMMREGVQDFHQERRNFFRVTSVNFTESYAEVEWQVSPDKHVFVLKPEFEAEE